MKKRSGSFQYCYTVFGTRWCICFNICYTNFRSRCMSFQYLLYRFQDQIVYVIWVYVIQVSGPDGLCHFSICYTGFRTRCFMSFQYVIQVSWPDGVRTLFYLQCEVDDNEQLELLLLRYSTFILFCSTSAPNTLFRHFDDINFYIFGENKIILWRMFITSSCLKSLVIFSPSFK